MQGHQKQLHKATNRKSYAQVTLLIIGIIFIAANLRAPITSVGPLISNIKDSLALSNTAAGIITTLPLLAFAFMSPFAAKFARRYGIEAVLLIAMSILAIGVVLRSSAGVTSLFVGTLLLGLAISVGNVLMPSLIKREFPEKIGLMTGIYSVSMNLCGAIASGISIPLAYGLGLGWKGALGCWGMLALIALLIWLPQLRKRKNLAAASVSATSDSASQVNIWRSPIAWQVTIYMGLQSLLFYVSIAWFPDILIQRGMSSSAAGWMLSLMQFAVLPATFIVPVLAGRMRNQILLIIPMTALYLAGLFGILYGGDGWMLPVSFILLGVASGIGFSLSMMFFSLRTRNVQEAAELSGMAQSIGYLVAALGPTLFGMLHDGTGGWTIPLVMLFIAIIFLFLFGMGAARNKYV
ncbi:MAG: CynX/NimT family MFS transporter [Candidatus Pristimantibacillus sp.]